jgi:hypothetical protein
LTLKLYKATSAGSRNKLGISRDAEAKNAADACVDAEVSSYLSLTRWRCPELSVYIRRNSGILCWNSGDPKQDRKLGSKSSGSDRIAARLAENPSSSGFTQQQNMVEGSQECFLKAERDRKVCRRCAFFSDLPNTRSVSARTNSIRSSSVPNSRNICRINPTSNPPLGELINLPTQGHQADSSNAHPTCWRVYEVGRFPKHRAIP